jgi:hypothetical protein
MCIVGTIGSAFVLLRYIFVRVNYVKVDVLFSFICSKELDRECDLVNVIVFLD